MKSFFCLFSIKYIVIRITQEINLRSKAKENINKRRAGPIKRSVGLRRYKKRSAIERFFSWIESCEKVFSGYGIKEIPYPGVIMLAVITR